MLLLIRSAINIAFTVFAVILLGVVNQTDGFKHIFATKRFMNGLIALLPVTAFFLFGLMLNLGNISPMYEESVQTIPAIALMQITSALMQTVLFRGLLITALFVKLSNSESERIRSIFKASALYLIIYIPLNMLDGANIGFMQLINTFVVGAGLCAAYMYSKNLLSLVLVQGLWQVLGSVIGLFSTNYHPQSTLLVLTVWTVIIISIVTFAIKFSKRAEPFLLQGEHNYAS
ncbi:MAG: hypothetical protein FWE92_04340 [Defluviitaleaceae bacterium]|nr:hypothetical protein [Defluviitaleaceae bacterium]